MNGLKNQTMPKLGECLQTFCGRIRINHYFLSLEFYRILIDYRPPTKFREANIFSQVCLSVGQHGPIWPLPMVSLVSHWPNGNYPSNPNPLPIQGTPSRHVQTCSPQPTGTFGHVQTYWKASGWP